MRSTTVAGVEFEPFHAEVGQAAAEWHAASARLLARLVAYADSGEWERAGIGSLSQWASINLGLSAATTKQLLATAHGLAGLADVRAALAEGRLSLDKAKVLARVATPDNEAMWLDMALLASATQLERIGAAYRRANSDPAPDPAGDRARKRGLYVDQQDDGMVRLVALLEPDDAAIVIAAVEAETERAWRGLSDTGREPSSAEPLSARQADALVAVAEVALEAKPGPMVAGRRPEVIVHVDAELLAQSAEVGECYLEGGLSISSETARRLCCDAVIRPLVKDAIGRILDFGRSRRTPSRRQRRALQARDRGCVFPGCSNSHYVDAHHIQHWTKGGATDLCNLCLLCKSHHRLHHEGGYKMIRQRNGRLRFFHPDGHEIGPPGRPPPALRSPTYVDRVDAGLARAHAGGEPFDLEHTVWTLLQQQSSDAA